MKKATPDCEERALRVVEAMLEEGANDIRLQMHSGLMPYVVTPDQGGLKANVWLVVGDGYSVFVRATVMQPGQEEQPEPEPAPMTMTGVMLRERLREQEDEAFRSRSAYQQLEYTNRQLAGTNGELRARCQLLERRVDQLQVELADRIINASILGS